MKVVENPDGSVAWQGGPWRGRDPLPPRVRERMGAPPFEFPHLAEQAGNFLVSAVSHVWEGMPETPPEILSARLATCKTCEMLKDDRCLACGCNVRRKASWEMEKCPLDKWPA